MVSIATRLLQSALFTLGPFYIYPWKPIVNAVWGDKYEVGLKHFKSGHRHPVNLGLHFAALFIQVGGNLAFLHSVDKQLPVAVGNAVRNMGIPLPPHLGVLATSSALSWALYLCTTPAPLIVSLSSASAILATLCFAVPHITPQNLDLFATSSMALAMLFFNYIYLPSKRRINVVGALKVILGMPAWYLVWNYLRTNHYGQFSQHRDVASTAMLVYLVVLSVMKNPLKPIVISGTILLRLVGILTGNDALFFLGNAFMASLFQGVTHLVSREEATLIALEREGEAAKLRFEYAHVTFFPNLLLETIYDVVTGKKKQ